MLKKEIFEFIEELLKNHKYELWEYAKSYRIYRDDILAKNAIISELEYILKAIK